MSRLSYAKAPFAPTRFPKGINNANQGENLGNLGIPDPTKNHTLFNDFDLGITGFTAVTAAAAAGDGGLVTITAAGSLATPTAAWLLTQGRYAQFKIRASIATVATGNPVFGFVNSVATPTAGVWISILNGVLTLNVAGTGSASATANISYAANAFFTAGFVVYPNGSVSAFFNDAEIASVRTLPIANMPYGTAYTAMYKALVADSTIDYVFANTER